VAAALGLRAPFFHAGAGFMVMLALTWKGISNEAIELARGGAPDA
jgi:hypothetical protein